METDEAALDAGVDLLGPRVDFLAKRIEAFEKPMIGNADSGSP